MHDANASGQTLRRQVGYEAPTTSHFLKLLASARGVDVAALKYRTYRFAHPSRVAIGEPLPTAGHRGARDFPSANSVRDRNTLPPRAFPMGAQPRAASRR